jgi:PAS domain S-box-containing protein
MTDDAPLSQSFFSDRKLDPSTQALTLADVRRPGAPLVYVNSGFEKMTGFARQEVIGRNCRFLQGPETSKDAVQRMHAAIATGEALIIDVLNYRKNGTTFWNRLSLTPVKSAEGITTHYIGIQSDISRLLMLQDRLKLIALELGRAEAVVID